ncbi:MAG: nucleotidyltransferase family protein [Chloroflexota bacterium]
MTQIALKIDLDSLHHYSRQHPIQRISLFGSVIREDFSVESDVDVLIQFLPDAEITYFDMVDIQDDLSAIFNRPVDLVTPSALSDYVRDNVRAHAVTIYGRQQKSTPS